MKTARSTPRSDRIRKKRDQRQDRDIYRGAGKPGETGSKTVLQDLAKTANKETWGSGVTLVWDWH